MPTRLVLLVVLFFLSLVSQQACAAPPTVPVGERNSIKGTVQDINAKPFSGVEVTIVNSDRGLSRTTRTSADGNFELTELPPGKYQIVANVPGFPLVAKELTVTPGQTASVELVSGPVPEGERQGGKRTKEVFQSSFDNENDLQIWLNTLAQNGKRVRAIVPVEYRTSLFLIESSEVASGSLDVVQRVNQPLRRQELLAQVNMYPDKVFVGVHRLSETSYLMVLRYGNRTNP